MTRLRPVIWAKGTFLTPQHLQAQDRFIESTLRFHLDALRFRPWGFRQLAIDRQLLASGNLSISSASGIFPDGLLFNIPGSDAAPPAKALAGYFDRGRNSVDVYLAIPNYLDRGLNLSTRKNAGTRFLAEITTVRDEVKDTSDKQIQIARKNFSLLAEDDSREGNSVLRIARVERTRTGSFQLDPNFIPPLLDVSASGRLMSMAHGLVEILGAKSTSLSAMRRQRNSVAAHFTLAEGPQFWLLYTVNTYFPLLRHILESKTGHPEALFSQMNSLAGALTTFSNKVHPRDLPLYDHDDLTTCFAKLDDLLRDLLKHAVPENFVSLPLTAHRPFIYSTSMSEERFFKRTSIYLAVAAEMNKAELIARVPNLIKVWSASDIDERINQAVTGIPLKHVENAPASIPVKANYEYFSLDLTDSGKGWDAVTRARNLAAHVPRDFPNPALELLIVLPEPATGSAP